MNIVSRWGVLVYQSESIDEPWDGRVDGQLAPSGVYVVNVEYLDGMWNVAKSVHTPNRTVWKTVRGS